jgi:hypothetical protein
LDFPFLTIQLLHTICGYPDINEKLQQCSCQAGQVFGHFVCPDAWQNKIIMPGQAPLVVEAIGSQKQLRFFLGFFLFISKLTQILMILMVLPDHSYEML